MWTQIRSSLIWVHTVCLYAKIGLIKFARLFSRRHKHTTFSDAVFLGASRVKDKMVKWFTLACCRNQLAVTEPNVRLSSSSDNSVNYYFFIQILWYKYIYLTKTNIHKRQGIGCRLGLYLSFYFLFLHLVLVEAPPPFSYLLRNKYAGRR